jgi:exopolysaccharide biosynthesis polyprenyl glycosylphosphotransferase
MARWALDDIYPDQFHLRVIGTMESPSATSAQPSSALAPLRAAGDDVRVVNSLQPRLRKCLMSMSPATWACLDAVIIALATSGAQALLVMAATGYDWVASPWLTSGSFCLTITIAGLVFGLYERKTLFSRSAIVLRSLLTLALGVVLAFAFISVLFYAHHSRWVGLSVALTYLAVALPLRLYAHEVVTASRVRVLCVGAGDSVRKLVDTLQNIHSRHYHSVGHVGMEGGVRRLVAGTHQLQPRPRFWSEADLRFEEACPYVGTVDDIRQIVAENSVDEIVVGSELATDPVVGSAVSVCLEEGCRVTDQATFVEKLLGEVPADSISAEWFLKADVQNHGSYEAVKRMMDLLVSALGLLISLPLLPLAMLIIRIDSRGPVFYKQIRVGQYGASFTMYKFRTMRADAEKHGIQWAQKNDDRVTRVGRFLRRTRLDEMPQLFNILRGDMSLVGPRPERPEFVHNLEQLLPHYRLRHLVKPGLSGWAQINYRYGASVADAHRKLCYDLYYLKHRSLDLDVAILIRTIGTFLLGAR